MDYGLIFGLESFGQFGEKRFQATLQPAEKRRIPILVPSGRWWLVFKYKFGDLTADVINFRFDGVRNYFEEDILIGTELLNFEVETLPYISISGTAGAIVVENTDNVARDFSIVLDFVVMDNEIAGRVREFVYAEREILRGMITKQAGTGGA